MIFLISRFIYVYSECKKVFVYQRRFVLEKVFVETLIRNLLTMNTFCSNINKKKINIILEIKFLDCTNIFCTSK